ncbi:MAG: alanine--tRNA ligase [Desulfobacterales bacterium]|nr:alanine--tRNA ligase [Desulfobacterales bacterium]
MTGNEVRQIFLDFFEKHKHQIVRSSSLVPADDPTLLFTNAGMVQFKRCFLGEEKRDYVLAATSQKCVRAGGKHNDLENVGYTARHHTFFEMLGNFSFGQYFKEGAIDFAWDLLINGYGLPEDKLWVSIYLDDDEAYDLWHNRVGVPADRIVRLGEEENFWAMGDTGPCGPCSEIHIDRGGECDLNNSNCGVDCDCDRFLEIWNLVFMQFNRDESGKMTPLPKPSIDTGMGLERMASIVQNVETNYDTDLMMPIMRKAEALSGKTMGTVAADDVAMKVIADHSRAAAFLIGDGVLPSNEGRGYVLRRIMRRAIRYGRNIGLMKPFLHETAQVVFEIMEPAYPDLLESAAYITNVIKNEEVRFSETLDNGLKVLNESLDAMRARGESRVPGDVIFKLYDTFGFPVDIVRDVVRDEGITLDMDGFEAHMDAQRAKSRSKVSFDGISDAYKKLTAEGVKSEFVGYEKTVEESEVILLVQDGAGVESADSGPVEVVTRGTAFYGESGGQAGDVGTITGDGLEIKVADTVKDPTGLIIHQGEVVSGKIEKGQTVALNVDKQARRATERNHTATHILHTALRQVLGDHVKQAGSLVSPDRFRFDFTHFSQVTPAEIEEIETIANRYIRANKPTDIQEMEAEKAFKSGATALFEEKYGDRVRVVSLGDFSRELCGGTHTDRTGNIGLLKIVSESSIASGVRRIEALTGAAAVAHIQKMVDILNEGARLVKDKPESVVLRIEKLIADNKASEKKVEQLKASMASQTAAASVADIRTVNGIKVMAQKVSVDSPAALRDMADRFKDSIKSGIVVLGAEAGGKALLIVGVTKDLSSQYKAGDIIKGAAAIVGGSGGGRPDMAQAGGTQPEKLDEALEKAYAIVEAMKG